VRTCVMRAPSQALRLVVQWNKSSRSLGVDRARKGSICDADSDAAQNDWSLLVIRSQRQLHAPETAGARHWLPFLAPWHLGWLVVAMLLRPAFFQAWGACVGGPGPTCVARSREMAGAFRCEV